MAYVNDGVVILITEWIKLVYYNNKRIEYIEYIVAVVLLWVNSIRLILSSGGIHRNSFQIIF